MAKVLEVPYDLVIIVIISRDYGTACGFKTLLHTHMDNVA